MFSNQGYTLVMINPHGLTGVSKKSEEACKKLLGWLPYENIINGLKHAIKIIDYMDIYIICVIGGSCDGYMINWIEGDSDLFKCLVNHNGAFNVISKFYCTGELWFQKSEFWPKNKIGWNPFDGKDIKNYKNSP